LTPFVNVHVPAKPLAARLSTIAGATPGILENSKPNALLLMQTWVEELGRADEVRDAVVTHKGVTLPPTEETLQRLVDECDFVLVGTGDCGSCLAWTVRSAVILEERGIPAICIGTDAFEDQFRLEAENCGMPDLRFVAVEHPLGGVTAEAVREKARTTVDEVRGALLRRDG
jgi:hypothetical protein